MRSALSRPGHQQQAEHHLPAHYIALRYVTSMPIKLAVAAIVSATSFPSRNTLKCSSMRAAVVHPVRVMPVMAEVWTRFVVPGAAVVTVLAALNAGSSAAEAPTPAQAVDTDHFALPVIALVVQYKTTSNPPVVVQSTGRSEEHTSELQSPKDLVCR